MESLGYFQSSANADGAGLALPGKTRLLPQAVPYFVRAVLVHNFNLSVLNAYKALRFNPSRHRSTLSPRIF